MKKIMNMMVNSCKKTTELIDKQQLTSLSAKEKVQLQVHKSMCTTCNSYEKQSKLIDTVIQKWFSNKTITAEKLPEDRKKKILEEIDKT
ncbi:hypothetical protein [Flavobacterium muglaense]|uniref:Zf-HC2 domain-containing protein n=1 Tax=Flavobacterium muglaense TaxID=2764716 RepID=A0A923N1P7_9FLAO|nr:hypothetical protein [Flavobacterium muglaense]MBC5839154.1 hypothetical protein [Flavobacterium muglaense]MBC5845632.1 hypothetical protein [Flavobacterium muglaense]